MFISRRGARVPRSIIPHMAPALFMVAAVLSTPATSSANALFFSGNLRTNANVTACGPSCTLSPSDSDATWAQWAAVVEPFTVWTTTTMEAITYSYGGGTSVTGATVSPGGLEPYLSLFDANGNFLASTYFGTTCPAGANSVGGNCFDVELDAGTLTPGTYLIALTDYENMSSAENGSGTNLSDGFTGLGVLQAGENLNYAFDVILPTNVPEPSTLTLFGMGCLAAALRISKKRLAR